MTFSRSPAFPILGLVTVIAGLLIFTALSHAAGYRLVLPARLALATAFMALGVWLTCVYWRRVDEAARDAQMSAWYWGGSIGALAGLAFEAVAPSTGLADRLQAALPHVNPLLVGGGIVGLAQVAGFLIAWAIWWAGKR